MNLIIGGCYGYNFDQIKYWINSATKWNCEVALIVFDCTKELKEQVESKGVKVVEYKHNASTAPHVQRFIAIYDYLSQHEYSQVVTTDVRDVIFQRDPFAWLEEKKHPMFVTGSECLQYRHEPWGDNNLRETYGEFIHSKFKNNTIYNVGVLAGQGQAVRDMCLNIAINSVNRPIQICDQAVFNVMIDNIAFKNSVYFAPVKDAWTAHLGTLADPHKMYYFSPNLLEEFKLEVNNGIMLIDGQPVTIIHQYDRTIWKDELERIYG